MAAIEAQYEALLAAGRAHLWDWRLDAAIAAFEAALRLRPRAAAAHYLRGEALFLARRLDEALRSHAAAVRAGIDRIPTGRSGAMSGLVPGDFAWMTHMLRGDFLAAWRLADSDREARRRAGISGDAWPRHLRPVWDGRDLTGARVLVRCYHGLGDTIQFIRYVPLLAGIAASVSVEAQPSLIRLLQPVAGIDRMYPLPDEEDRACAGFGCDAEIDVTELPHAFRTTLATIPAAISYLQPEPAAAAAAARRIACLPGRRVGVVWAAGEWKPERSIAPDVLAPLAAVPGIAYVNLQGGREYARWRLGGEGPPMADLGCADSIEDTAAVIAGLDLVIAVDTMAAHLAGALGVPVWLLLHCAADWRWLLGHSDSPWYPTMRLFRQAAPGDWRGVIEDVAARLPRWAVESRQWCVEPIGGGERPRASWSPP